MLDVIPSRVDFSEGPLSNFELQPKCLRQSVWYQGRFNHWSEFSNRHSVCSFLVSIQEVQSCLPRYVDKIQMSVAFSTTRSLCHEWQEHSTTRSHGTAMVPHGDGSYALKRSSVSFQDCHVVMVDPITKSVDTASYLTTISIATLYFSTLPHNMCRQSNYINSLR